MKQLKTASWRDCQIVVEIDPPVLAKVLAERPDLLMGLPDDMSKIDFFLMMLLVFTLSHDLIFDNVIENLQLGHFGFFPPADGSYGFRIVSLHRLRFDPRDILISDYIEPADDAGLQTIANAVNTWSATCQA